VERIAGLKQQAKTFKEARKKVKKGMEDRSESSPRGGKRIDSASQLNVPFFNQNSQSNIDLNSNLPASHR